LDAIYRQSVDFQVSRMYPGVPEYFNNRGRGMYPYLTGSASWYLLTVAAKVFGVTGKRGNLSLSPRLLREQFDAAGDACLHTLFAGRTLDITYHNPSGLDYGAYRISAVRIDGQPAAGEWQTEAVLPRSSITTLAAGKPHWIEIDLGLIGK
jgi:cellobiose phosphorylase